MHALRSLMQRFATVFVAFFLAMAVSSTTRAADEPLKTVSTEGLKALIDAKKPFVLVDARTPEEFKDAHIVSAINLQEKEFEAALPSLPSDHDALMVFYCNGVKCGKSKKVALKAKAAGYRNLLVYGEGFPVWEEKGLPIVTGPNYDSKVKTVRVAAKDLATLLKEKPADYVLVDVREPKEYAEGHIPGAANIPVGSFAAKSGELPKEKGIIVYCNTGKRSYLAYRKLMKLAYPSILEGTFVDWKDAGLPIAK